MSDRSIARPRPVLAVWTALLVLVLAGCGGSSGAEGGRPLPADSTTFTGTTLDGARFDNAVAHGKPEVLWFWAPWCTVCRAESGDVADVAASFDGEVTFVGVPGRGKVPDMRGFVSETGTDGFQHVADVDGRLWKQFGVSSQPSFVFVDGAGHATRVTGNLDAGQLRSRVTVLLAG